MCIYAVCVCAQVLLLLCYWGFKENKLVPDLDVKSEVSDRLRWMIHFLWRFVWSQYLSFSVLCQLMMASMFRFVKDDVDGLSLDEGLDKFLTKDCKLLCGFSIIHDSIEYLLNP